MTESGTELRQMKSTNCPDCGTTQIYSDGARVVCMCCRNTWTAEDFEKALKAK